MLTFPFDKSALIQTIHAARDASVRTWVQETASRGMPILVLRGANSLVWSHEEFVAERTHFAGYPSVVFEEVQGAGHGLPFEQRVAFLKRLREFLGHY
jgi:pimeloyl-ACP methyl ester carboxylesterase